MTIVSSLLPNGKQQFLDQNGVPLVGGHVYFYIPTTSTPKNTWQDPGATILNINPVTLDSRGQALIYGQGQYRQVVLDADGNTIWDQLTYAPGDVTLGTDQTITARKYFNLATTSIHNNDGFNAAIRELRDASGVSGGSHGFVNHGVYLQSNSGASEDAFEWALTAKINNNSNTLAENVAIYGQAYKNGTSPTWGMVAEGRDLSGSQSHALYGLEVDCFTNGSNTGNNRLGAAIYSGKADSGGATAQGYAGLTVEAQNSSTTDGWVYGIVVGDYVNRNNGVIAPLAATSAMEIYTTGTVGIRDRGTKVVGFSAAGTYSGAAFRMPQDTYFAYEVTNAIKVKYNSSDGNIEWFNDTDKLFRISTSATPYPLGALVVQNAAQTITNNSSTALTFGTADYNNHGIWSAGTPTRLTVSSGVTHVRLTGQVAYSAVNASNTGFVANFKKNGSTDYNGHTKMTLLSQAGSRNYIVNVVSPVLAVTAGDYFEFFTLQDSGGSLDTDYVANPFDTWFCIEIFQ